MNSHTFKKGDKVRITNVSSHLYGENNFNEGDVSVVTSAEPLLGIVPGVLVAATKLDTADAQAISLGGVPFAGDDLQMLTKVED